MIKSQLFELSISFERLLLLLLTYLKTTINHDVTHSYLYFYK